MSQEVINLLSTLWARTVDERTEMGSSRAAAIGRRTSDRTRSSTAGREGRREENFGRILGATKDARGDRSRLKDIPRVTRGAAARARAAQEAEKASEVESEPPASLPAPQPTSASPPAVQQEMKEDISTRDELTRQAQQLPAGDDSESESDALVPAPEMDIDGDEENASPTTFRGHSEQLEEMERMLRSPTLLAEEQQKDFVPGPPRKDLEQGMGETGDYGLDDQNLIFHAPQVTG